MSTRFTWDAKKAAANQKAHGVTFEEATTVFDDPNADYQSDWEHGEPRMVALGFSTSQRVLFVVQVEVGEDTTRIISARKATSYERKQHEEKAQEG